MGTFQGRSEARRSRSGGQSTQQNSRTQKADNHNAARRELYATDPAYAERQRRAARESYRKDNPLSPSKLTRGLLYEGTQREVTAGDMEHPVMVATYTIPEAARALGRSELTFKRWISEDLVPDPILVDTTRGYRHYSTGELRVIAAELAVHEREFSYYTSKHEDTRHRLMQRIQGYRASHI